MLLHESADDVFSLSDGADDFSLRNAAVSVYMGGSGWSKSAYLGESLKLSASELAKFWDIHGECRFVVSRESMSATGEELSRARMYLW